MATIWARSTGAWGGSIWDYFNENTQQIEAYPFANPQSGDIVYCNGFTITISGSIDIGNGTFTNGVNPYTNISGGHFGYSANPGINITGDCEQYGNTALFTIHIGNSNAQFNINGNLYNENNAVFSLSPEWNIRATFSGSFNIGNVSPIIYTSYSNASNTISLNISNIILRSSNVTELVHTNITTAFASYVIVTSSLLISPINVNVTTFSFTGQEIKFLTSRTFTTATITGNVELNTNNTFTTANITGTIKANSYVLAGTTLNINGSINYTSSNNTMGIRYTTLNILNPDTFTWKDITEPRSNPFIILTDAELNNHQQYPAESDVKLGTDYAFDNLHGKLSPDYPQQAEVLDDVEYARYEVATNNLALYNSTLYLYNGSLWSTIPYLGETTTNVTDSTHSVDPDIDINGVTTTATDGDIVKYGAYYYMWDDANTIWVKTDYYYIGETTTDISGGSTRSQLFIVGESMKGTMIPVNLPQTTLDRLANCVTVDILDAQLNAKL